MRRFLCTLILFSLAGWSGAKETSPADTITIEPGEGEISPGQELTLTFPAAMISADKIDLANQPSPLVSSPKIEGDFIWKSQTEGIFTVKSVVAGAKHRLALAPGLRDLAGKLVGPGNWSADFKAPEFSVTCDFEKRDHLNVRPQVSLETNYDVVLADVAEHVYFQDRDSRARLPVEVIVEAEAQTSTQLEGRDFRVTPREALPAGRTYDVIVNGLVEANSHQPLPYLKVFPAGTTEPMEVEWVGAFNSALDDPVIRIKFSDSIDPAEATANKIEIQPTVLGLKLLASGDEVAVKGRFDIALRYRVKISTALKGERGYGLASESNWGATFHPKDPAILFPAAQVFLRQRQQLRFSFFQINTPALTWKIAQIPLEKLPVVRARVREFERNAIDPVSGSELEDPRTGLKKQFQTELLSEGFSLPVIAQGKTEASGGDAKVLRNVESQVLARAGSYLIEASAVLPDGRVLGNRSIICVSDYILTQKRTAETVLMRVAKMSDARPVAGVLVRAVTSDNAELARETTDKDGIATFSRAKLFPEKKPAVALFAAEMTDGAALQFADNPIFFSSANEGASLPQKDRAEIVTDGNLYRPGQIVKMKGLARKREGDRLTIPAGNEVKWRVTESSGDRIVGEGAATLSGYGGWEAEWPIPEKLKVGNFRIRCQIGGVEYESSAFFNVEEYRVPLFSVVAEADDETGQTARARVSSAYFHGAPNVGARVHWKATWTVPFDYGGEGENYKRYNAYSELGPRLDPNGELSKTIEGDAKLDPHGFATLACESPFKDNAAIGKTSVYWRTEVTSLDGQTITGGVTASLFAGETRLGVKAREEIGQDRGIKVETEAIDQENNAVTGVAVRADLFHVVTKTAKEQIAPFVFRYRNTDQFTKVASHELKTPEDFVFPETETGRYVVALGALQNKSPLVSNETILSGEQEAELPVENETSFKLDHETKSYLPGENAVLSIAAPFGGVAWVSVETDKILDTQLVPIAGNAGRIELPIKKEYAPNATVTVYLVKPGGGNEMPRERFASSEIEVRRPDQKLEITTQLASAKVKPGEVVRGEVHVVSENKPVADADLAVFAVDDAVLKLGDWKLPEMLKDFYGRNPFSVRTYQALERFIESIAPKTLTQKGFVIGDGGEDVAGNVTNVRKEFKRLAFWQGSLKTGTDGKATFEFSAPDNLTAYRVVAVGETKTNQFGGDASAVVQVSKPLLINPALPRFLRDGDEVELRAVAQQNFANSDEITARCVTDGSCKLIAETEAKQAATRDAPVVFRFRAKINDPEFLPAKIRFEVNSGTNPKMSDAVEITLPVLPPTIVRKEATAGSFNGPRFIAQDRMPEVWRRGHGTFNATISTSPWLPKLAGIPLILDYPHGCFDQISTKLLGYSLLANLLAYLPDTEAKTADYRRVLEQGMKQFNESLVPDGMLPYWPGGDSPNPFVTCEAFWAVNEAAAAGFEVPEGLRDKLARGAKKILNDEVASESFTKVLALFVLSQFEPAQDYSAAAQELYLRRNKAGDEDRALLAVALHRLNIMPREKEQLLKEVEAPAKDRAFDPKTLSSLPRAEAIIALAFETVSPQSWNAPERKQLRERMLALMDSSAALSTQENLWLLLAFKSMVEAEKPIALTPAQPAGMVSKNGRSAAWPNRKMNESLAIDGLNRAALTFLLKAEFSTDEVETDRVDRGFRVERVVKNLTDAKRTGLPATPFKIGDQLLLTYRINSQKKQNYVSLEDSLPAGIETVNPNLAQVAKFFALPENDSRDRVLALSHSEMRDRATLLYFDDFAPGTGTYSVLARATAAGTFRWPATQVVPMYDSRFSGLSPSSVCVIGGE